MVNPKAMKEGVEVWLRGDKKAKEPFVQAVVTNVQQEGCAITRLSLIHI